MRWTVSLGGGPEKFAHVGACVGDCIYSFGGSNNLIEIHMLNTKTLRWALVPQTKHQLKPSGKFYTVVAHNNKIYLWNGRAKKFYSFDPKNKNMWAVQKITGNVPSQRAGYSMCVADNYIYIYGGFGADYTRAVHSLNLETMEWKYIQTNGEPPSFHSFHSAAVIHGRMYIFGGEIPYSEPEDQHCSQIVYLDLTTKIWHHPPNKGEIPVRRNSQSMFVHNGLIYAFGGYDTNSRQLFNDVCAFDPISNCWHSVKPLGNPPLPRILPVCIMMGSQLFLFGTICELNENTLVTANDTHVLDFEPSLRTLSILTIIENRIDTTDLPEVLRQKIRSMKEPNSMETYRVPIRRPKRLIQTKEAISNNNNK